MLTIREIKKVASLEEAWQLNQKRPNRVMGGMLWMRLSKGNVATMIDLSALGLDKIEESDTEFSIGAMVTLHQLELHEGIAAYTNGAMKEALRHIVGVQFRNLATVGGSVFGRFGFSDVLTILMALDAKVELYKSGVIAVSEFAKMPYDRDILVRVLIPKQELQCQYASVRIAKTDFPVLTCAAAKTNAGVQLAVGAKPAKAALVRDEQGLLSNGITEAGAKALAEHAASVLPTESNPRGSAAYRAHLIKVLAARTILALGGKA